MPLTKPQSHGLDEKAPPPYTDYPPDNNNSKHNIADKAESYLSTATTLADNNSDLPSNLGAPLKTYNITTKSLWTGKRFEIHNSQNPTDPILWVRTKQKLWTAPFIHLHTDSESGPIVASCKTSTWSSDLRFHLGNPDCTDPATWTLAKHHGWTAGVYDLDVGGRSLQWKRTRNRDLGASKLSCKNFKLVDEQGRILAVFIFTQSLFGKMREIGRVEFFAELGTEVELAGLVVLLGIEENIRQQEQAAAGS